MNLTKTDKILIIGTSIIFTLGLSASAILWSFAPMLIMIPTELFFLMCMPLISTGNFIQEFDRYLWEENEEIRRGDFLND